jgi:hypothetical protein
MENFDPMTSVVFAQTGGAVFGTCGSTGEVVDQQWLLRSRMVQTTYILLSFLLKLLLEDAKVGSFSKVEKYQIEYATYALYVRDIRSKNKAAIE